MAFADPHVCPNCKGAIAGQSRCLNCGLDLTSVPARQLWQTLLQADVLLAEAARSSKGSSTETAPKIEEIASPPAAPQDPPFSPTEQSYAPYPSRPGPASSTADAATAERRWSVGTILLVLGAFGLIVAGLIFVTRSWGDLGLVGRTLVLSGVTTVIGALGVWVTRRPLRASAEAVWTIFLALLTLDFFAARHEGMVGLEGVRIEWAWLIWGIALLGLGVLIGLSARRHVNADLVAPSIAGAFGITIAGIGGGAVPGGWDLSWRAFIALVVAGVLALAARPAKLHVTTISSRVVVAGFYLFAYVAAFVEMVDHPSLHELVIDKHGIPMALMALASVVVAAVVRPLRIPTVALAVFAVTSLVTTPASDASDPEGVWLSVAGLAAIFGAGASRGRSAWVRGARLGSIPVVAGLAFLLVGRLIDVGDVTTAAIDHAWVGGWNDRLDPRWTDHAATWPVPLVMIAVLVVAWFVPRWPESAKAIPWPTSIFIVVAGVGLIDAVVATRLPLWSAAVVLLVVAVVLVVLSERVSDRVAGPTAAALVLVASLLAISNDASSAGAWICGAGVLVALVRAGAPKALAAAYAYGAAALALGGVVALVEVMDVPRAIAFVVALLVAIGLLAISGLILQAHAARLPVELAGGLATIVALLASGSTPELAVRWTIAGVLIIALGFVVADRRWYFLPGIAALVVAYILLIVDSGFSFVEAYTLPVGAAALAVGLFRLKQLETASTWPYLGPGLALALLPSVPQALADPTGLRALLLGIAAVVSLALGIRLGWKAPFIAGVTVVTSIVLFNIGPYANAAPRVVLIAGVSAVLLGVGITWEDRVRDSRLLVKYVRSMR